MSGINSLLSIAEDADTLVGAYLARIRELQAKNKKLEAVAEAARAFMKVREHHGLCALRIGDGECDCGYAALEKALKELENGA